MHTTYGILRVSEPHEPVSGDYYRESDPKWIAFRKKHKLKQGRDPIYKWYQLFLELCANGLL